MLVSNPLLARQADVEIAAGHAAEATARFDLIVTDVAGRGDGWRLRVVEIKEHHHRAVLGPPDRVELKVISTLAQVQERLQARRRGGSTQKMSDG